MTSHCMGIVQMREESEKESEKRCDLRRVPVILEGTKRKKCTKINIYCLSNAMYSSIGQNIKALACPMSDVRCLMSGV